MKDNEIIAILAKRDEAKAVRDWTVADKIRDELRARGIEVGRYQSTTYLKHRAQWQRKDNFTNSTF